MKLIKKKSKLTILYEEKDKEKENIKVQEMESSQNFIINNDNINIVLNQKEEVKIPIIIDKVVINIEFLQIKENKKEQKNVLKNNYISENHEKNKIK